ncbi:MAG: hypothetical protein R3253_00740 [Longimicrobiales bacterium]|nr:hypothetical protein [Longimicrobiales bacterium]
MADGLRSLRWRGALGLLGLAVVLAWIWMAGGTTHLIQIDYSWAREMLDSAEVEIDGQVVGILQRYGRSNFVTGFEVEPGAHVVRVSVDGCAGVPDTARLGGSYGRRVTFMADVDDGLRCRVLLR